MLHPSRSQRFGVLGSVIVRNRPRFPLPPGLRRSLRFLAPPLALAAAALLIFGPGLAPSQADAATLLYPNLQALPPSDLRFDGIKQADGRTHWVLRFSAVVWNAGEGPLELRAAYINADGQTVVAQKVFDRGGHYLEFQAGNFVFHPSHDHWHFERFAAYELWPRAEYDAWLASGRRVGGPRWLGSKTTGQGESVCMRDDDLIRDLPGSPDNKQYRDCGWADQGISVGWADKYDYRLPDQWIDCGTDFPPDGDYVVRLVADPFNEIYESPDKADWSRESQEANEAVTYFSQQGGFVRVVGGR